MLKKILKYDMREMLRRSSPLYILSGAFALLCCGLLFFVRAFEEVGEYAIGVNTAMSVYLFGLMGIAALMAISLYQAITRYYRSLFSDEGYLNMLIPTDMSVIVFGKLISTYIWSLLSILTSAVSTAFAIAVPNLLYDPQGFIAFIETVFDFIGIGTNGHAITCIVFGIIHGAVGLLELITVIFLSITLGRLLFRRRRLIGSVIAYLCLTTAKSFVIGIGESILLMTLKDSHLLILIDIILALAVTAGSAVLAYFANLWLMKNKINLD